MGKSITAAVVIVCLIIIIFGPDAILLGPVLGVPIGIVLWIVGTALGWFKE